MERNTTESIRESYDRLADAYARRYSSELESKPRDRELLDRFVVEVRRRGDVCDMGCGPGHIARYVRDRGTSVFGLDLSPRMVEQARKLNPDISFQVGDMMALDLQDEALAGIIAFYAIVNIPLDSLRTVFQEMARVLQPGGLLLLSFHIGDEILRPEELLGQPISMDFFFFWPIDIRNRLEAADFVIEDVVEREPYAPEVEAGGRTSSHESGYPRRNSSKDVASIIKLASRLGDRSRQMNNRTPGWSATRNLSSDTRLSPGKSDYR